MWERERREALHDLFLLQAGVRAAQAHLTLVEVGVTFLLVASSLSFLGLGQQPPAPSWGSMLNVAKNFLSQAPWSSACTMSVRLFSGAFTLNRAFSTAASSGWRS